MLKRLSSLFETNLFFFFLLFFKNTQWSWNLYRIDWKLCLLGTFQPIPVPCMCVSLQNIVTKRVKDVYINSVHKNVIPLVFALNTRTRYDSQTDHLKRYDYTTRHIRIMSKLKELLIQITRVSECLYVNISWNGRERRI